MSYLVRKFDSLVKNQTGAVAVYVAIMSPVLMGVSALAVDLSLYRFVDSKLQTAADAGALAALRHLDNPYLATLEGIDFVQRNVPVSYGTVTTPADIEIGIWEPATNTFSVSNGDDVNAIRITAERSFERGNAPKRFLGRILGSDSTTIRATAVAARQQAVQYEPPVSVALNTSAGDFNEMYAYCFDYLDDTSPIENRRSQMTLIANNLPAGTDVSVETKGVVNQEPDGSSWPVCKAGESLSFRQRNIRHAKAMRYLWNKPWRSPHRPEHNHYTDTTIEGGVETFNLQHSILETVTCDNFEDCDPGDPNNILPSGGGRSPNISTEQCSEGKYVYFGWEDRPDMGVPAGHGNWTDPYWTDLDFDDNRIVMKCPQTGVLGDGRARLVR